MLWREWMGRPAFFERPRQERRSDDGKDQIIGRHPEEPVLVPGDKLGGETGEAVVGVEDEPEKIFGDPEEHQAAQVAGLQPQREIAVDYMGKVKNEKHEGEDPGVVAGHRPATPEDVEEPVLLDAPGRQSAGPPLSSLDLDFHHGEEESQQDYPEEQQQRVVAFAGSYLHDRGSPPPSPRTVSSTDRAALGLPSRSAFLRSIASSFGSSRSFATR